MGKGGRGEGNINVWLPLMCPLLGTWPITQACTLTGNRTGDPLVHRMALDPLSYTSQGCFQILTPPGYRSPASTGRKKKAKVARLIQWSGSWLR